MSKKKGMVLKIRRRSCIVLTPQGDFIKVPLSGRQVHIGEEISFDPPRHPNTLIRPFLVAASILLLFIVGQVYQGLTPSASAQAYVSLDINPSIELAVNDQNIVIAAKGLNSGGEQLLKQVKVLDHNIYETIELVINEAIKVQYMLPGQENVVLTTFTVANKEVPAVDQELVCRAIEKPLQNSNLQAEVVIEPVTPELRTEAQKAGLSSGRYLLYQQSKEKGLSVSVEELKTSGMSQWEEEKKVKIKELVPGKGYNNSGKITVEITPIETDVQPAKGSEQSVPAGPKDIPPGQAKKENPHIPPGQAKKENPPGQDGKPDQNDRDDDDDDENEEDDDDDDDDEGKGKGKKQDREPDKEKNKDKQGERDDR